MGSVIREDTEGEPSAPLTETGKGGLLSQGYLRDAPALEYVGDGETAVFVMTDESSVVRQQAGESTTIDPGSGYRAITVVTDRRIIVLVGAAGDGDKRITLPLVEVQAADHDEGNLVVTMTSGVTWRLPADDAGLEEVSAYVAAAARTWVDVEATLDDAKRAIVTATGHRDDGDYDDALSAIREAREDVETVASTVEQFADEWPSAALEERVETVRDRCLRTAAEVRVGHARATVDEAESHWRAGEYGRARDAYEAAREAFAAVESLAPRHRTEVDGVEAAVDRLDRTIEQLDEAPLQAAIDAENRAEEASGVPAVEALAEARERYAVAMAVDPDADENRFAGDRERIREHHDAVTDRLVETARDVGTEALEAGEWYCATGKLDLAAEELERAMGALETGLDAVEDDRPEAAESLRSTLASARETIADLDGGDEPSEEPAATEAVAASERNADEDADATRASAPAADRTNAAADGGITTASAGDAGGLDFPAGNDAPTNVEAELRSLSSQEFDRLVETVLEAMGWRPEPTASSACDYLATGPAEDTIAVTTFPATDDGPLQAETVRERARMADTVPRVDGVTLATTRPLPEDARAAAEARDIEVLDAGALADALGGGAASTSFDPSVDG